MYQAACLSCGKPLLIQGKRWFLPTLSAVLCLTINPRTAKIRKFKPKRPLKRPLQSSRSV
ncbi:hypothetical protein EBME_1543 [bacterium endosymbiont of Mortierella elongata FMR23-6]|nr:hypothetical protein EBME_1543 [bacterium endosymbiont of Mortierella elongata FMR23-6]